VWRNLVHSLPPEVSPVDALVEFGQLGHTPHARCCRYDADRPSRSANELFSIETMIFLFFDAQAGVEQPPARASSYRTRTAPH